MSEVVEEEVVSGFATLGLDSSILGTLKALGYESPTPIQTATIPALVAGRDVLGEAATGTGKTAAFALPLLQRLAPFAPKGGKAVALVLVPTRELAMQVTKAFQKYGAGRKAKVVAVYGGAPIGPQIRDLVGAHIVVATPGRVLDHLERQTLDLSGIQAVVLDEADEMLDMGFTEDLEKILNSVPAERQTALFSATMPKHILSLTKRHQKNPIHVQVNRADAEAQKALVDQLVCMVPEQQKMAALERLLLAEQPSSALIFCRTREDVDAVSDTLNGDGFAADAIHGGLSQQQRDSVMARFRDGRSNLLVATDVAARGLDISGMSHVFNFDLPEAPEVYVHRIGRTGRAGKAGTAISFCAPFQNARLRRIEALQKTRLDQLPVPTAAQVRSVQMKRLRVALETALADEAPEATTAFVAELAATHGAEKLAAAALTLLSKYDGGPTERVLQRANDRAFEAQRPSPPKFNKSFGDRPNNGPRPGGGGGYKGGNPRFATTHGKPNPKPKGKGNWVPRHLQTPAS